MAQVGAEPRTVPKSKNNSKDGSKKGPIVDKAAGDKVISISSCPVTPRGKDARRDVLKARKFQALLETDMLPKVIKDEYDEIQKTKSLRGSNYRARTTDLIDGSN